jgi:hypothetical protein
MMLIWGVVVDDGNSALLAGLVGNAGAVGATAGEATAPAARTLPLCQAAV